MRFFLLLFIYLQFHEVSCNVMINEYFFPFGNDLSGMIELYNDGGQDVNLSSWKISKSNPPTYTFPTTSLIKQYSYFLINQRQLGISFTSADMIYLFNSSGTVVDSVMVKDLHMASGSLIVDNGISIPNLYMKYPTPGKPNFYPLVGPVVITEVLFYQCIYDTYLVIQNSLQETLPLWDFCSLKLTIKSNKTKAILNTYCIPIGQLLPQQAIIITSNSANFQQLYSPPLTISQISSFSLPSFNPYQGTPDPIYITLSVLGYTVDEIFIDPAYYNLQHCQTLVRSSNYVVSQDPRNWLIGSPFKYGVVGCSSSKPCQTSSECVGSTCSGSVCQYTFNPQKLPYCGEQISTYKPQTPFTAPSGYITDLYYHTIPLAGIKSWLIQPPSATRIFFQFVNFYCSPSQYLAIYDGININAPLLLKVSGPLNDTILKTGIYSTSGSMFIYWGSSGVPSNDDGFYAYYTSETKCNSDKVTCETCRVDNLNEVICGCTFGYTLGADGVSCTYLPPSAHYSRPVEIKNCNYRMPQIQDNYYILAGDAFMAPSTAPTRKGCYSYQSVNIGTEFNISSMDLSRCSYKCSDYTYFGVYDGTNCVCTNTVPSIADSDDLCNIPCTRDPKELCGGINHVNIWKTTINCYVTLTPLAHTKSGAMWFKQNISSTDEFRVEFDFQTLNPSGADGFAFVMQNTLQPNSNLFNGTGGLLGYDFEFPLLAVEFDLYYNEMYNDPGNFPHIGIQTAPDVPPLDYSLAPFGDGLQHHALIKSSNGVISVFLDNSPIMELNFSLGQHFSGQDIYLGFTGTTGGVFNEFHIGSFTLDVKCKTGFVVSPNSASCIDMDECKFPNICAQQCVNTPGSYECRCNPGYELSHNLCKPICGDQILVEEEECDGGQFCNSNCQCYPGYSSIHQKYCQDINECLQPGLCSQVCVNTPGNYSCQCFVGYNLNSNEICSVKPCVFTSWGPWSACSKCEGTNHNRTRDINNTESAGSPACSQIASQLIQFVACRYPCYTDKIQDAVIAIDYLKREWENSNWIQKLFDDNSLPLQCLSTEIDPYNKNIMHIYVTEKSVHKRVSRDCSSDVMKSAEKLILDDTLSIISIPEERVSLLLSNANSSCEIQLQIVKQNVFPMGEVLGGVIGGIVLLVIIALIGSFQYQLSTLRTLPPQLHWTFVSGKRDIFKVTWRKKNHSLAYYRSLSPSTNDFEIVRRLFEENLGGKGVEFEKIWAVYNEVLITTFFQKMLLEKKRNKDIKDLYQKKDWKKKGDSELREFVYEQFVKLVQGYSWNTETSCPVIPALHGTSLSKAFKICDSGFTILGLLDKGYYGQGIYVTTHAEYALRYTHGSKRDSPAIIIAYLLPGNPYPVTEDPKDEDDSLAGSPIKTGYQSHYVRVKDGSGMPIDQPMETSYDEIVIGQEAAIIPAFILKLTRPISTQYKPSITQDKPSPTQDKPSYTKVSGEDEDYPYKII